MTLFFGSFQTGFCQKEISGIVVGSTAMPIAFANVILLAETDSTAISGTVTTEDGKFLLKLPAKENYLLKVSFIGYETSISKTDSSKNQQTFRIVLTENTSELKEVRLYAERPRIVRKADRLIFNVENTSLSSDNAWGILEKTPGVISIQGSLKIRNAAASIYINGRKVNLPAS
ncbi:MAG TPA: carboxypeptidase-like regulatory domain-containing protein, partial [Flavobacteriaceae bacterium]|nr:carboxypeptidase-like regulatory domain-containing protein [Flavobacteriaceae bacterium]